jgi:hypothetical protein
MYRAIWIVSVWMLLATSCRTPISALDNPKPVLTTVPTSQTATAPDPASVTRQLRKSVAQVRKAVVGIEHKGYASGVVISPNGYVLSVAHVAAKTTLNQDVWMTFESGRRVKAKALGYDASADLAIFKLAEKGPWPHVKLADKAPPAGAFCFTVAHPTGFIRGRPAQARLGRITSVIRSQGKPFILQADVNIQPGDSGGPLFDLNGLVIGVDSSAVGLIGFNRFGTIDQFHLSMERMIKGERFGNAALGPSNTVIKGGTVTPSGIKAMRTEFMRRLSIKHRPTVDFAAKYMDDKGNLHVSPQQVADGLGKDALPLMHGQKVVLGMDDPAMMSRLPKLPSKAVRPIAIHAADKRVLLGLPVTSCVVLVKYSDYAKVSTSGLRTSQNGPVLRLVAKDMRWDLALIDCGSKAKFNPVVLSKSTPALASGQGLLSLDVKGRIRWGVVMGPVYEVKKGRSKGPLNAPSLISDRRAPYLRALPHDLPLFAADACTPVFTFDGTLVGIHVARLNRTTGLIVTVTDLHAIVRDMLKSVGTR